MVRDNEDLPPSYDEVIKQDSQGSQGTGSGFTAPQMPPRPTNNSLPPRPPRPSRPTSASSSQRPPRPASSRPPASPRPTAAAGNSSTKVESPLPWTYPTGFYCSKCGNTGYKIKNGRSCKQCWRRFARANPDQNVEVLYQDSYQPFVPFMPFQPFVPYGNPPPSNFPPQGSNSAPLIIRPGDPRIGGVVCGECRGKGMVRFILDEKLCPLCRGVGRI